MNRPLGQAKPGRDRAATRISMKAVAGVAAAVVLIGGSAFLSLRDDPLRSPSPMAVSEPEMTTAPAKGQAKVETADAEREALSPRQGAPGASIIRVNPEDQRADDEIIVIHDPAAIGQNPRVAHLPDRSLIEASEMGPLPVRNAAGLRPFDVYARPWSGARGARIALMIGGLGISQTGTQRAIERLPSEITLAFASQGNSLSRWMQTARREGHEIMIQLPLEPFDYPAVNPGPRTLLVRTPWSENVQNLHWALSRMTNYTGVINYMGARFTADPDAMGQLMEELGQRGLAYVDDGTSARSLAETLAPRKGVPFAAGDTVIDAAPERGAILKKLDELERIARARGYAVGTGSALDMTVETVATWSAEVRTRGIELVPVSAVALDPEG
ncbi:divergent polysaccharide deacetylase family protein [Nitratireductor luteus]|uniref:divergent polysaccharide deacetylase family protein n=1 Tax=Nitratireductor luteus TaxID=2976980 RepID=UPI00223EB058|nr:divergent polysaccharide deacetylase family protein [Nitratireductor luteus]